MTLYLPVKTEFVICCGLTSLQTKLYKAFTDCKALKLKLLDEERGKSGGGGGKGGKKGGGGGKEKGTLSSLSAITSLKKLCNHPDLIYDKCVNREEGFEELRSFYPPDHAPSKEVNREKTLKMIITVRMVLSRLPHSVINVTFKLSHILSIDR